MPCMDLHVFSYDNGSEQWCARDIGHLRELLINAYGSDDPMCKNIEEDWYQLPDTFTLCLVAADLVTKTAKEWCESNGPGFLASFEH